MEIGLKQSLGVGNIVLHESIVSKTANYGCEYNRGVGAVVPYSGIKRNESVRGRVADFRRLSSVKELLSVVKRVS